MSMCIVFSLSSKPDTVTVDLANMGYGAMFEEISLIL